MKIQEYKKEDLDFNKVWAMFQETSRQFKETDKQFKETGRQFKETDKQFKETDKRIDKIYASLKNIGEEVRGIGKSNGEIAEDFFYNGLAGKMQIGNTEFEFIDRNQKRFSKKHNIRDEYDILLTNDNIIVVVEVKYKVRIAHIEKLFSKKIPNFRKLFPRYSDYNIIGAIAGFTFDKNAKETAINNGFYVFSQAGDDISILNNDIKYY